ncbi:MAG: rubredoxin [Candidatus Bathyarchaeota archaeon]|uniref:rubredoxin n=1 Tax=Candidatus Bathycorpusculum sp. TaxID=2994959 RepID=UPI00282A5144|nr:rubredoxin [Candidatus Termiticorpusculum sp.]MCL2257767.1 rubredoxin [Candidatus Termiticorpusculum sp.]MCL2292094.1 rubredoxin [Candidatus Termiticorpusculum sp.]
MQKFICSICGYVYDESVGSSENGIAQGTTWESIPDNFVCPICGAPKSAFKLYKETPVTLTPSQTNVNNEPVEELRELSTGEISIICASLAKGCEKQQLSAEMEAFNKLADYFKSKATIATQVKTWNNAINMLDNDITKGFTVAKIVAQNNTDRGALRSLIWSEKVSTIMKALLERFVKDGEAMLENTKIWVCDICGFIYIGDIPPKICPVCRVPNFKILEIERS